MSSIFVSRAPAAKTEEQKKVSKLALKMSTAAAERMKSGPCTVLVKRADPKTPESK